MKASEDQGRPQLQSVPALWSGWVMFGAQGSNVHSEDRIYRLKTMQITADLSSQE